MLRGGRSGATDSLFTKERRSSSLHVKSTWGDTIKVEGTGSISVHEDAENECILITADESPDSSIAPSSTRVEVPQKIDLSIGSSFSSSASPSAEPPPPQNSPTTAAAHDYSIDLVGKMEGICVVDLSRASHSAGVGRVSLRAQKLRGDLVDIKLCHPPGSDRVRGAREGGAMSSSSIVIRDTIEALEGKLLAASVAVSKALGDDITIQATGGHIKVDAAYTRQLSLLATAASLSHSPQAGHPPSIVDVRVAALHGHANVLLHQQPPHPHPQTTPPPMTASPGGNTPILDEALVAAATAEATSAVISHGGRVSLGSITGSVCVLNEAAVSGAVPSKEGREGPPTHPPIDATRVSLHFDSLRGPSLVLTGGDVHVTFSSRAAYEAPGGLRIITLASAPHGTACATVASADTKGSDTTSHSALISAASQGVIVEQGLKAALDAAHRPQSFKEAQKLTAAMAALTCTEIIVGPLPVAAAAAAAASPSSGPHPSPESAAAASTRGGSGKISSDILVSGFYSQKEAAGQEGAPSVGGSSPPRHSTPTLLLCSTRGKIVVEVISWIEASKRKSLQDKEEGTLPATR